MTICTIDVHARDVVAKLISQKASVPLEADLSMFPESGIYCQGDSEKLIVFQKFQLVPRSYWLH